MPLPPQLSSKAISRSADRHDAALPAILEFKSPSSAVINVPVPRSARGTIWVITSLFFAAVAVMATIKVDQVVTAPGRVVAEAHTIVLQPLDTAIVRSINVHEGQVVHAGEVLARLDPTFTTADVDALSAQVSSLQAEVSREQAESDGRPFTYSGMDRDLALQAAIFAQRQAEYNFKLENYQQKIDGLTAAVARAQADADGYRQRLQVAQSVEQMRLQLEKLQVGSKLNTDAAKDNRLEMARNLANALQTAESSKRDLTAMITERAGYIQSWHADVLQKLSDAVGKLSDARQSLNKAQLHQQLVELRADRDATVLTVAKVSVGSVLQSGQEFITLVPADSPLEVEANIAASDDGFVHVGDSVAIKFDTFPYSHYGMGYGTVRIISADSFSAADEQRTQSGSVPMPQNSSSLFYRARLTIDRLAMRNVPEGFKVVPGMPITADIKVGKRTVLSYLLTRLIPTATEGMREP